jgi:hypothetical protein
MNETLAVVCALLVVFASASAGVSVALLSDEESVSLGFSADVPAPDAVVIDDAAEVQFDTLSAGPTTSTGTPESDSNVTSRNTTGGLPESDGNGSSAPDGTPDQNATTPGDAPGGNATDDDSTPSSPSTSRGDSTSDSEGSDSTSDPDTESKSSGTPDSSGESNDNGSSDSTDESGGSAGNNSTGDSSSDDSRTT